MPTSDSEDFESADEGQNTPMKTARKQRLSSSNYSDKALESDQEPKNTPTLSNEVIKSTEVKTEADGWDDFDIDDNDIPQVEQAEPIKKTKEKSICKKDKGVLEGNKSVPKKDDDRDTGWDDFDDWGNDDVKESVDKPQPVLTRQISQQRPKEEPDIKGVTDKMASALTGGWGWGWSVDTLLSTATAGISTITNQVSQGISNVLETGIGAPDPEELARQAAKQRENKSNEPDNTKKSIETVQSAESGSTPSDASFQFGNILSGVTKFVETTGTKVISGGLGTLETIGKKTMEVLQDGDPGLAKKRAMLGLAPDDKPVLSQILREAKAKADEEDKVREEKREAKEVHYENLFDDFEGLVHLEALEMLSRQVNMRIEERMRGLDPEKKQDLKETLQQVAELCEMPEDEDDEEEPTEDVSKADAFHERLQTATQDLGLKLQFQPIVKQYSEVQEWVSNTLDGEKGVYKRGVSALAQSTALCVSLYHRAAQMLLLKTRRSTADEADALTQMTVVLKKHVSELATLFTDKLNSLPSENKEQINNYITNLFLEADNSCTYIQNAFQLALPILQVGAV